MKEDKEHYDAGEGVFIREVEFSDIDSMARLAGRDDENINAIEERYPVRLVVRGNRVAVRGPDGPVVNMVYALLEQLHRIAAKGGAIHLVDVR